MKGTEEKIKSAFLPAKDPIEHIILHFELV